MNEGSLKAKAATGMFWNAIEYLSVQAGQFGINIILARLLLPNDFGLIGMLAIFMAISQAIVDSGLGTALVQKKDRTETDYSTVFIFNLALSISVYLLLFIAAPLIAAFYDSPSLSSLIRILTLNIIINSLGLVQITRLTINLNFKTMAKVNVLSVLISGFVAIYAAMTGWGVWALVVQLLVRTTVLVCCLWIMNRWFPKLKFSIASLKSLLGFGSKLLGAAISGAIMTNIYKAMIGKKYTASLLGHYSQAFQYTDITAGTVTSILQKVTFPIMASLQDDREKLVAVYRRILAMSAFFIFPVMTLLSVLAKPFILVFLTDKWLPAVSLLQWLCFARIFFPISVLNMNVLNAVGRSDLFLKVDLSKIPFTIIILLVTIPLGIKAVVIGHAISSFIAFFINAYMPGKLFNYGPLQQLRDMLPKMAITVIMAFMVIFCISFIQSNLLKLVVGILTGICAYGLLAVLSRMDEIREIRGLTRSLFGRAFSNKPAL